MIKIEILYLGHAVYSKAVESKVAAQSTCIPQVPENRGKINGSVLDGV